MKAVRQLYTGLALAVLVLGTQALAQGKIATSRHNFSAGGVGAPATSGTGTGSIKATSEQGICVFCHTPHKGNSSLLLWNHQMSANSFSWSDMSATTGGTAMPTNLKDWAGSTAKCLSCHDGSVAVGAIYFANADTTPDAIAGAGAITDPTYLIANGADLKGNHPVGVPVPLGAKGDGTDSAYTYNQSTTGTFALRSGWQSVSHATGLSTGGVKIFTGNGAGLDPTKATNNMGIECASCHDPHGTNNPYFLRVTKDGSRLCLSCHNK